jgi:hypothetical protein
MQAGIGQSPQGVSKFRFLLRCRYSDTPLLDDHRGQHPGPVAIVTELRKKLRVALALRVFEATTDPDLGVIVRALRPITFGSYSIQMHFDEYAIRNRPPLGVGQTAAVFHHVLQIRFCGLVEQKGDSNLLFNPNEI